MVRAVQGAVQIPLAVKLSPFYTSLAHFARRLDQAGADGLVLFNRFYQPDIDIEELQVRRAVSPLPLLGAAPPAALAGHPLGKGEGLAGGHRGRAHRGRRRSRPSWPAPTPCRWSPRSCSAGPAYLATLRQELTKWLEEHDYESLRQMQGSMNLERAPTRGSTSGPTTC